MEHFICKSMENQRMQCEKTEYDMEQYSSLISSLDLYPPHTFPPQPLGPS